MSYLLDKKIKRNNIFKYSIFVVVLLVFIYFRSDIFDGFSYISSFVFRPILVLGNGISEKLSDIGSYFSSKEALFLENENLKRDLSQISNKVSDYNSILDENFQMKEILGRKTASEIFVLGSILAKPNQSPYDTLIIDVGADNGIIFGQKVFALGNVPIGYISQVYANSAKVVLFSNPGEITQVVVSGKNTFMQLIGRGGGNFEMVLPRDFVLQKGTEVVLPGITPFVVGVVETIISDPRDAFQKALLVSPVNIQELQFVEVEK
jgi:cell shape-determining protein MreC